MEKQLRDKLWPIATQIPFEAEYWLRFNEYKIGKKIDFFHQFEDYFLELGSGWGEVAIELAKKNSNLGFILVEKKKDRLKTICNKIKQENLENVRLVCLNFNWFFKEIFEENLFKVIFMNFPDPWPKKRHHKHRSVNLDFIQDLHSILLSQGKFYFATDHKDYALDVIELFESNHLFSYKEKFLNQRTNFPMSYFERLQKSKNKTIYYLERFKV